MGTTLHIRTLLMLRVWRRRRRISSSGPQVPICEYVIFTVPGRTDSAGDAELFHRRSPGDPVRGIICDALAAPSSGLDRSQEAAGGGVSCGGEAAGPPGTEAKTPMLSAARPPLAFLSSPGTELPKATPPRPFSDMPVGRAS